MLFIYHFLQRKIQVTELSLSTKLEEQLNNPYSPRLFYFRLVWLNIQLVVYQIVSDFHKFLIILLSDPGNSFNLFFRQRELRSCPFSYSIYKNIQAKIRIFSAAGVVAMVIVAIVSSIMTNLLFGFKSPSKAASYGWLQSAWSILSTSATATPASLLNWDKYFSADNKIAIGNDLKLTWSAATTSMTYAGNFLAGAMTNTEIIGSNDASIKLQRIANATTLGANVSDTPYFYVPSDVALDKVHNKIFAIDNWGRRVVKFDSGDNGTIFGDNWQHVGSNGTGINQFDFSSDGNNGIDIDVANNKIYVADSNRVIKFDSGEGGTTFGGNWNSVAVGLAKGLSLDLKYNKVYVCNDSIKQVIKFDTQGSAAGIGGNQSAYSPGVSYCFDTVVDSINDKVYVAGWNKLVKIDSNGSGVLTGSNRNEIAIDAAYNIAIDTTNNKIYTPSSNNTNFYKFDSLAGAPSFGSNFTTTTLAFNNAKGMIIDTSTSRIIMGERSAGGEGITMFDTNLASSSVSVSNIVRINAGGTRITQFNRPTGIFVDTKNNKTYIVDQDNGRIVKCDSGAGATFFCTNRSVLGGFTSPQGVFVDVMNNKVYVAGNNTVYKFDSQGAANALGGNLNSYAITGAIDVFVDIKNNKVFVPAGSNIYKFDSQGPANSLGGNLVSHTFPANIYGVSVDTVNNKIFAIAYSQVFKLDSEAGANTFSGANEVTFGTSGAGVNQFSVGVGKIFVDSLNNKLYIADTNNKRLVKMDSEAGASTLTGLNWTTRNVVLDGLFNNFDYINGIHVDTVNSKIYVSFPNMNRVAKMDSGDMSGKYYATGDYVSPAINFVQRSNSLPMVLSWDDTQASVLAGTGQIKFQISSSNDSYSDNFDAISMDGSKWSAPANSNGATQSQVGGRWKIVASTTSANNYPNLPSVNVFAGDFDVQVDYDMTGVSNSAGNKGQQINLNSGLGSQYQCAISVTNAAPVLGGYMGGDTTTQTSLSAYVPAKIGKIRAVRVGNVINCYIFDANSSGWVNFYRYQGGTKIISPTMRLSLLVIDDANAGNSETFYFDNYIVWGNNGGILGFYGPDGSTSTYYTTKGATINSQHNGAQYLRYKAILNTDFVAETPAVDAVRLSYQYYGNIGPSLLLSLDGSGAIANGSTILDSSGKYNHAVASSSNGSMSYTNQTGSTSALNQSMNFDGVDDSLRIIDSNQLNNFTHGLTISLWAKSATTTNFIPISRWGASTGYGLYGVTGFWYMGNGVAWTTSTAGTLADSQWHHYVLVWDKLKMNSYRDGVLVGTSSPFTNPSFINPGNGILTIGGDNRNNTGRFSGQLDEVSLWDKILTPTEVQALYNNGTPTPLESGAQPALVYSSPFDSQSPANMLARLSWSETLATGTDIRLRVRTSAEGSAWTPWRGPDGTSVTWFTIASGTEGMPNEFKDGATGGTADQFMQYQAALFSDGQYTPVLDDINLTYVVNGPPAIRYLVNPIQTATGSVEINYEVRDLDTASGTTPGKVEMSLQYCTDPTLSQTTCPNYGPGSGWATGTTVTGDIGSTSVSTVADGGGENSEWTTHAMIWQPASDWPEQYRTAGQFKIRLTADDGEIVNRYGYATSTTFELDTKKPIIDNIAIKADLQPNAEIQFSVTEDTAKFFRISINPTDYANFTDDTGWQAFTATTSFNLDNQPTLYAEIRDSRNNRTTSTITMPDSLRMTMIQDTSNLKMDPAEYRLFTTWKRPTTSPEYGFDHYNVYRSYTNDSSNFSLVATVSPMNINYFTDTETDSGLIKAKDVWYIVSIEDNLGNTSYRSASMWGFADGTQNAGEGGGGTSGVAPKLTNVASTTYTSNAIISWDTDTRSDSLVYYQTTESCDFTGSTTPVLVVGVATMLDNSAGSGRHQVTVTGLAPATTYYFQPRSTSPTGVTGMTDCTLPGLSFTTAAGAAIIPSSTKVIKVGNDTAEIFWETDLVANSYVVFSTSSNMSDSVELGSSNLDTKHTVTLFGLTPGKLYYFDVKSGNDIDTNEGKNFTFTTTQDLKPPTISNITPATTDHSAVIQFATAKAATSTVTIVNNINPADIWTINIDTFNSNHYFDFSGLSSSTRYNISILARDSNGNTATATSFMDTAAAPDITPPEITIPGNFIVTDLSSAVITWSTNEEATSYVQYAKATTTFETDFIEVGRADAVLPHTVTLDNLTAGTTYYFRVKSTDLSRNTTISPSDSTFYSFQPVLQILTISNVATSTVTDSQAVIVWSTNHQADSLILYGTSINDYTQNQASVAQTTEHAITINGLTSSTPYYYLVVSKDALGQTATSTEYQFTTAKTPVDPNDYQARLDRINELLAELDTLNALSSSTASTSQTQITELQTQISELSNQLANRANLTPAEATALQARISELEAKVKNQGGGGMMIIDKTDKVAPVISNIQATEIKSDSVKISWLTNEKSDSFIEYSTIGQIKNFGNWKLEIDHSTILENLLPNSSYAYKVASKDESGNITISKELSFTTPTLEAQLKDEGKTDDEIAKLVEAAKVPEENKTNILLAAAQKAMELMGQLANQVSLGTLETTILSQFDSLEKLAGSIPGPILGGSPTVVTGATTANVSWLTDKEANSLVAYAPEGVFIGAAGDNGYLQVVGDANNLKTTHEVRIAGLKPNTTYHYQLRSKAQLGPEAKSRDFTFKTREEGLEILTYDSEVKDPTTAVFRWSTNLESDTKLTYTPYRSGKLSIEEAKTVENKITTTMHELTAKDLESGIIYQISLQSKDQKNRLAEEVIEQFTTSKDDLPPTINSVQTESALSQGKQLKVQTIISWQTNEPTIGYAEYVKGVVTTDQAFADKTPEEVTYGRKHVAVVTKFESGQVYTYRIVVSDSSGNKTISKLYTILTPKQKESVFQLILKNFEDIFGWVGKVGN